MEAGTASLWLSGMQSGANLITNSYIGYKNYKAQKAIAEANQKVKEVLTGVSLAITMNSASRIRQELSDEYKRAEFEVLKQARAAEGQVTVEAARAGATGRRVQLAQDQAIEGKVDAKLGAMKDQLQIQYDELHRQETETYTKAVMDLISGPVDVDLGYDIGSDLLGFAGDLANVGLQYYKSTEVGDKQAFAIPGAPEI